MTKHHPAVVAISARVVALYGLESVELIFGRARSKTIAEARAVAMWAARLRLGWSYPELGRAFDRDHTTILSACDTVAIRLEFGNASALMRAAERLFSVDQLASCPVENPLLHLDESMPAGRGEEAVRP